MTRNVLAAFVCVLTLVVGIATTVVQAGNHAEAFELDKLWTECRMLEAINDAQHVEVLTLDLGPEAGAELDEALEDGLLLGEGVQ